MKKVLLILSLIALLVPIAYARAVPAYGDGYWNTVYMNRPNSASQLQVTRMETVRMGKSFTRTVPDGRHRVAIVIYDKDKRTITLTDWQRATHRQMSVSYDASGNGQIALGGKSFKFMFDPKYGALKVAYYPS